MSSLNASAASFTPTVNVSLIDVKSQSLSKEDVAWENKLKAQLILIVDTIPDITTKTKEKLSSSEAMKIWRLAFTHQTYSASDNYEKLEYLGDAVLKLAFPYYLMQKNPALEQNQLTNMSSAYMSKDKMFQAQLAQGMGLDKLVRIKAISGANVNINTDLFESFFGALFTIGENMMRAGGYKLCYNLLEYILNTQTLDFEASAGDPKTRVNQLFSRFKMPGYDIAEPVAEFMSTPNGVTITIRLTKGTINFINGLGGGKPDASGYVHGGAAFDIKDPVLAQVTRATKAGAESAGYIEALASLKKAGELKTMEIMKHRLEFYREPEIKIYAEKVFKKMTDIGYGDIYFSINSKLHTTKGSVVQLIGVDKDNKEHIIDSEFSQVGNTTNSKVQLVKRFLAI